MRQDPLFLLWVIDCPTPEECRRLRDWVVEAITPEATFVDEVRTFPEGNGQPRQEPHRLGDYFESIQVWPSGEQQSTTFRLLFRRRAESERFWKDLMARALQRVRDRAAHTTTTLEYRGDEESEALRAGL